LFVGSGVNYDQDWWLVQSLAPLREGKLLIDGSILLGRDTRLRMRGYDSQTASAFKKVAKKKLQCSESTQHYIKI
jgi:hypothetical protein